MPRSSRWCSALLLATAAACAGRITPRPDAELTARARLLRIADTRHDEPAYVDSLLQTGGGATLSAAIAAVGQIGARPHAARLRELAVAVDTAIAADALFALGQLRDTSSLALAVAALRRGPSVAIEGGWLLGEIGEPARSALVAAVADSTLSVAGRGAALLAIARLKPPTAAAAPLIASADSALAWRAAYVIARGRVAAGARALVAAAESPFTAVREQVARGLTRALVADSLGPPARAALRRLARDAEARVRVNAVRSLATFGEPTRDALLSALGDSDAAVRLTAVQGLDSPPPMPESAWGAVLAADTSFAFRRAAALAAARHAVELPFVSGWRESGDWRRRAAALEVIARRPDSTVWAPLEHALADPDGRVRATAVAAVEALPDSGPGAGRRRALLERVLLDADVAVRTAALRGLSRGASETILARAIESYHLAARDADADARLAFWVLVDSTLAHGDPSPRLLTALDSLSRPTDPLERSVASRIPRFAAWRDRTGTARPLAWYEERAREAGRSSPRAEIETERGTLQLELFAREAPLTVYSFVTLARRGYFDGLTWHRVVPNFVVQGGDPRGDGSGGPGYALRDEINRHRYHRGTLGMALSGADTGGSQFFITHSPQPHLDGGYTVFGQLRAGADVLDHLVQGDRIVRITIH